MNSPLTGTFFVLLLCLLWRKSYFGIRKCSLQMHQTVTQYLHIKTLRNGVNHIYYLKTDNLVIYPLVHDFCMRISNMHMTIQLPMVILRYLMQFKCEQLSCWRNGQTSLCYWRKHCSYVDNIIISTMISLLLLSIIFYFYGQGETLPDRVTALLFSHATKMNLSETWKL